MAKLGLSIPAMELRTECGRLSTEPWPVFLEKAAAAMDDLASGLLAAGVSVHLSHNGLLNKFLIKVLLCRQYTFVVHMLFFRSCMATVSDGKSA
jgi:hypothetical protein